MREAAGAIPDARPMNRRARPTLRCLTEDLGLGIPGLGDDLGGLDHPWIAELRRIAPRSPQGQKRILSIAQPLVYRLRVSSARGVTWVDEEARSRALDSPEVAAWIFGGRRHSGP